MTDIYPIILDQVELAFFPNDFEIKNPTLISADLINKKLIDENTLKTTPIPPNIAVDVNRLEFELLAEQNVKVYISQKKIDFFWNNKKLLQDFSVNLVEMKDQVRQVMEVLKTVRTFNRVGIIRYFFREVLEPENLIRKGLLRDEKGEHFLSGELKLTYDLYPDESYSAFKYNKHYVIATGYVMNDQSRTAIIFREDLNTRQNQDVKWTLEEAFDFFKKEFNRQKSKDDFFKELFGTD